MKSAGLSTSRLVCRPRRATPKGLLKAFGSAVLALVFVVLCSMSSRANKYFVESIGLAFFFTATTVVMAWDLLRGNDTPVVVIDHRGIIDRRFRRQRIEWTDVLGVCLAAAPASTTDRVDRLADGNYHDPTKLLRLELIDREPYRRLPMAVTPERRAARVMMVDFSALDRSVEDAWAILSTLVPQLRR